MKFLYGWNVYIIYSMYIKVMSILSFLPLLFLSQSLVFIAVVFIVIIFWLSVSSSFSFHSWCYWVFLFVYENTIISFLIFTFPHTVLIYKIKQLWILVSGRERVLEVTIYTTWILIPKVINVYEKRRFIFLIVDDILCTW